MKIRVGKCIIAVALALALAAGTVPASAAPIQYAPLKYVPQHGLTVTFYQLKNKPAEAGHQLTDLFKRTPQLEQVSTVLKTVTWTSGMRFDQATVSDRRLDKMSWAGMTGADWVEISGWIWMSSYSMLSAHCGTNTRMQVWADDRITVDWQDEPNHFSRVCGAGAFETPVKIRIRLSPIAIDANSSDPYYWPADCWFELMLPYSVGWTESFADYLYPRFPVDAFRRPVMVLDDADLVYVDRSDLPACLDLNDYEFGVIGGKFETLNRGDNYIAPKSGQYAVRAKAEPEYTYVLGALSVKPPADLKIARRTPTTVTLAWTPAKQSSYSPMPPVTFEIYRKLVGWDSSFGQSLTSISTLPGADYAGSTTETTFTDKGLLYDAVYEYFVRAVYPEGYGNSVTVNTGSANMEGLLMPPKGLAVASNDGREVVLQWQPVEGARGYQVVREDVSTPYLIRYGTYVIGKTATATFKDTKATGMEQQATYRYYVQALDAAGIPSRLSIPIEVVIRDSTPPSAPGNFWIEGGSDIVLLGPTRQVSMSWEPSTDNVGVVGYDILRSALGCDGTLPGDTGLWQEPVHKVGSTTETTFTDAGLQPGACYTYYVAAKDAAGNTSQSRAFIIAHCPYLLGLAATGDGKAVPLQQGFSPEAGRSPLDQAPATGGESMRVEPTATTGGSSGFQYNHGEYFGVVDNATKTLTLMPTRIDPKATVLVNGHEVPDGMITGPFPLDIGENRFTVEVISRPTNIFWGEARMTYTVTVVRANLAPLPVLTVPSAPAPVPEGTPYRASGSMTTVATGPWLGTVDYGDGSASEALTVKEDGTFDLLHTYADNGEYKAKVTFRYLDLGLVTATVPVTVANVPPSIVMTNGIKEYTAAEGSAHGLSGAITDPGADTWTLTADFGDSSDPVEVPVNPGGSFYVQHVFYDDKPAYKVILSATDDDGGTGSLPLTVNVTNVAPVVDAGGPAIAKRGVTFQRAGSFVDPGRDRWTGTLDFGDGSGKQVLALAQDKSFLMKHVYARNGQYTVTVRVVDNSGAEDVERFPVVVKDYAFSVEAGADLEIAEGATFQTTAQIAGPTNKVVAMTVDYGDGSAKERLTLLPAADGQAGSVALNHTYSDDGKFSVKVTLIDADGYAYEDSFAANVLNVAPTVKLRDSEIEPGDRSVEISGSFTDPGSDAWTGTVDFGDGSAPRPLQLNQDKTFAVAYTYGRTGVFTAEVTVRDDDGGEGVASCRVVVRSHESSDARLRELRVADDTLIPGGAGGTYFSTDCATLTPTVIAVASNDQATLEFFDAGAGRWVAWPPALNIIQFSVIGGKPVILIRVTAENGRTLIYTIEHQ